ncbi:unnamed protein product [Rhizoctonia solani]|uniref:Uncharacterized protein n=1 Tax=Rhizoctonia solani TaxID=456999 RepID=A0A8H3GN71_9AGAM|nr:unnamed protein product [Rhizoctonia solani]
MRSSARYISRVALQIPSSYFTSIQLIARHKLPAALTMILHFFLPLIWLLAFVVPVGDFKYIESLSEASRTVSDGLVPPMFSASATLLWPPAPMPISRRSPPMQPVYSRPTKSEEPRNFQYNHNQGSMVMCNFVDELIHLVIKLVGLSRLTKTSTVPTPDPTKTFVAEFPAAPTSASRVLRYTHTHASPASSFYPVVLLATYKLAFGWFAFTFITATFAFVQFAIRAYTPAPNILNIHASASPIFKNLSPPFNITLGSIPELNRESPCSNSCEDLVSPSRAPNLVPENILLPTITDNELVALDTPTLLPGSALVDAASALFAGIDAKNRVEGTTDMNGASTGGKKLEPAVLISCISDVSRLCEYYETYRPPNLAKYPPEDRIRVKQREVRLAEMLQGKRRCQDSKEGTTEKKPQLGADFAVWMEMMKHGCIPGDKERPGNWSLRSIARWKAHGEGRNGKVVKVKWADEV